MADGLLEALFDEHGDWDACAAALQERVDGDEAANVELWLTLAEIHLEWREDAAAGAEALEGALEADPGHEGLVDRLVDAYTAADDWESVAAVLVDAAERDDADGATLLLRAADIYDQKLAQPEGAQLLLKKALDLAPADARVHEAVEGLWMRQEAASELADLLRDAASVVSERHSESGALPLLLATARAYTAADKTELADAFLTRAGLIAESDLDVLRAQVATREGLDDTDALVESLSALAEHTDDRDEALDARRRLAALALDGDASAALAHASAAFELSDDDDDLALAVRAADAAGDDAAAAAHRHRQVDRLDAPDERAAALVDVAAVEARFDIDASIRTLNDALIADETSRAASDALCSALAGREAWPELIRELRRRADVVERDARQALLLRVAEVAEIGQNDPHAAVLALEEALELPGDATAVRRRLLPLYVATERGADAAAVEVQLAEDATDDDERVDLLLSAARRWSEIEAWDDAEAPLRGVVELRPGHQSALAMLDAVLVAKGDAVGAIASLEQRVQAALGDERYTLSMELGDRLRGEPARAAAAYGEAVVVDPRPEAIERWVSALRAAEAWVDLADALELAAQRVHDPVARAARLAEAATVRAEQLDAPASAAALFESAIELDPTHVGAARFLGLRAATAGDHVRAVSLLPAAVAGDIDDTREARAAVRAVLGESLAAVERAEDAITSLEASLELVPDARLQRVLAALLAAQGHTERADAAYRALVDQADADALPDGWSDVLCDAAEAARGAGDAKRANTYLNAAIERTPGHGRALRLLAGAGDAVDVAERVRARRALVDLATDANEATALRLQLVDDLVAAGDADAAIAEMRRLIDDTGATKVARHKLLALLSDAGKWGEAAEVLEALADAEGDDARRAKLLFTIGALHRDQRSDVAEATRAFRRVLDIDAAYPEAFAAIEAMHSAIGGWQRLEEALRRQLGRIAQRDGAGAERLELVMKLGALYRDRLNDPEKAIEAFRTATQLDADHLPAHLAVADLYPKSGKDDEDVIAEHRAIVRLAPEREESHHVLLGALQRQRRFDEAWQAAASLTVLGCREAGPTAFYQEHRPERLAMARRALSHGEWRALQHPGISPEASRLLAAIGASLRRVYAGELKAWGVHKKNDRIDATQPHDVVNLFHYAGQALGVALPELYAWKGAGTQNANVEPRALLVGADLRDASADRRAVFRVARAMCLLRNEYYLATALTPPTLVALVRAVISLFTGGPPDAWKTEPVLAWMEAVRAEPDEVLTPVAEAVAAVVQSGKPLDLEAWPRAVELSAHRAGLLLCGDLQRAASAAAELPTVLGGLSASERVLDLIRFASTDTYGQLRGESGLGIGQG